ncbi:MAG: DUF4186 family protein [Pseudomonadota bacterium]
MNDGKMNLPPLKVTCIASDCDADLHCFKFHSRKMKSEDRGNCRSCGVGLINWERVHARNPKDIQHTFSQLKQEFIRHHFWHKEIDEAADKHARRKGKKLLRDAAERRIRSSVGNAQPVRDGQQTPMSGNILYYAQHATASCCRTCMEYWHDIPKGRQLLDSEVLYLSDLIMRFVGERMPRLREEPENIPRQSHVRRAVKRSAA